MRRFLPGFGLISVLLLAGCVPGADGIDGDLNDEWPAMRAAETFVPQAETCHSTVGSTVQSKSYSPVACAQKHFVETLHVGQLTGPIADLAAPPEFSDAAMEPAYAECDKGVNARLGRNWRDYQFDLIMRLPTLVAWQGGARWVRCDVVVPRDLARTDDDDLVEQIAPLRGAALEDVLLGCFDYKSAPGASLTEVGCTKPHNAEYVGSTSMPSGTKYPDADAEWDKLHDKCFALAAAFVGVTESALTTGVSSWVESQDRWNGGDRSIRCYLWLDKKTMSSSAKDSKGQGIPK
ncbi:MAG TPA: hypothetical protein DGT23_14370 [Micromonosporaceae bacterium]|nr:hypothetical protein [Micromonosporaceae bacterium]